VVYIYILYIYSIYILIRIIHSLQWVAGPFPGVKSPPSSAEVKERVELCLYSSCGPLWPVLGRILLFFLPSPKLRLSFAHKTSVTLFIDTCVDGRLGAVRVC
jgi:hypothetical protein